MRILGVGLSRTGTSSLHRALQILGFKSIHFDCVRLNDVLEGSNRYPNFRRYDDVDAVTDLPTALFYRELLKAYPECKAILTVRDLDSWWESVSGHCNERYVIQEPRSLGYTARVLLRKMMRCQGVDVNALRISIRNMAYGSTIPHEFLYKKRYLEHNERVRADVPDDRLLVMDIAAGDGWKELCRFLEVSIPSEPFPHRNKAAEGKKIRALRFLAGVRKNCH